MVKTDCGRCFDPSFFSVKFAGSDLMSPLCVLCGVSTVPDFKCYALLLATMSCGGLVCSDRFVLHLNTSHNSVLMKTHEKSRHLLQVFFTTVLEQGEQRAKLCTGSTHSLCQCEEPFGKFGKVTDEYLKKL